MNFKRSLIRVSVLGTCPQHWNGLLWNTNVPDKESFLDQVSGPAAAFHLGSDFLHSRPLGSQIRPTSKLIVILFALRGSIVLIAADAALMKRSFRHQSQGVTRTINCKRVNYHFYVRNKSNYEPWMDRSESCRHQRCTATQKAHFWICVMLISAVISDWTHTHTHSYHCGDFHRHYTWPSITLTIPTNTS